MRIFAKFLLTGNGWLKNQIVAVRSGRITGLTAGKKEQADHAFDCVLPGMVNAHSHAFQWAFAGTSEYKSGPESDSFWSWREQMYETALGLTEEQIQAVAASLYARMLEAGYTRVAEFHYLHKQASGNMYAQPAELSHRVIRAALEAGIGICHLPVLYQHGGFGQAPASARQRRFVLSDGQYSAVLEDLRQQWAGEAAVSLGVAPHSLRAVDVNTLCSKLETWASFSNAIHIHIAEQPAEIEACLAVHGKRPIELLLGTRVVDERWSLVHATHATEHELVELAASKARVVLCPTTEANLGDGLFPLENWRRLGGVWGVGSDSHVSLALSEELRWLEYGMRLRTHQRACYAKQDQPQVARNLYWDAVCGGRAAIGLAEQPWVVGEQADCLGFHWPSWWSLDDPDACLARWMFGGEPMGPAAVMATGQWRVWEGQHIDRRRIDDRLASTFQST